MLPEFKNVLVVEDEQILADLLSYMLAREGYRVTIAKDGLEAKQLASERDDFGLIILDLMLPYISGQELLQWLRSTETYRKTPVLVLTGLQSEEDVVAALDNGANDYITKPFQPKELHARLRRIQRD